MFIDHRTQNLNADSALLHWIATYRGEGESMYRGEQESMKAYFHGAVEEFPEGTLFHYKSSGEEGYAIVDHGRIVWRGATKKY